MMRQHDDLLTAGVEGLLGQLHGSKSLHVRLIRRHGPAQRAPQSQAGPARRYQRHHGCAVGQRGPRACGGGDDWAPSVTPLKLGFTDLKTVFVNVQHPGDEGALAAMSSNWPSSQAAAASGRRPRPSTIVVTHKDGGDVGV
jgi:hypothetical protein